MNPNIRQLLGRLRNHPIRLRDLPGTLLGYLDDVRQGRIEPDRFCASIALGVAIGLFPAHGIQTVVWAIAVVLFPVEPLLVYLTSWIGNALTAVPITWLEIEVGALLRTGRLSTLTLRDIGSWQSIQQVGADLVLGGFVVCLLGYCMTYLAVNAWVRLRAWQQQAMQPQRPQ